MVDGSIRNAIKPNDAGEDGSQLRLPRRVWDSIRGVATMQEQYWHCLRGFQVPLAVWREQFKFVWEGLTTTAQQTMLQEGTGTSAQELTEGLIPVVPLTTCPHLTQRTFGTPSSSS
ncbi:hypothetical protein GCK32_018906 [Trichostrongylus colubriformis]|uniref:Uncharacterized protein n=1 Tax=Trichostrongylus colubriformis TaxID=6319 RepID=A0AAN8FD34_TRICO